MKPVFFAVVLVLATPAALAQQRPQQPSQQQAKPVQSFEDLRERAAQSNFKAANRADREGWLESMKTQEKLRAKLAQAWESMGMTPEGARQVADAYDPELAARSHHTSLRGKSDQEIAQLLQDALKAKKYLKANQLLIDYQRQKLALNETSSWQSLGESGY